MKKYVIDVKHFIILAGYVFALGQSSVLFLTFIMAYFNDTFQVIVDINKYNEAHIELFMMFIVQGLILMGLLYFIAEVKKKGRIKDEQE